MIFRGDAKVDEKNFEVGGPLSTIWGLYFKSRNPKFPPTRKKRVFRVADFFEKSRKQGVIFEGAPQNFFIKTYEPTGFPEKK